jgi:hypothetical protein
LALTPCTTQFCMVGGGGKFYEICSKGGRMAVIPDM